LVLPDGSKEPAHSHDWVVTAAVSSEKLDDMGVVMDFRALREIVANVTAELDNTALGDIEYFCRNNPSAENVARYIYEKLRAKLPEAVKLQNVRVMEEPGCWAEFSR